MIMFRVFVRTHICSPLLKSGVYIIKCDNYEFVYVGQTRRNFNIDIKNTLQAIMTRQFFPMYLNIQY